MEKLNEESPISELGLPGVSPSSNASSNADVNKFFSVPFNTPSHPRGHLYTPNAAADSSEWPGFEQYSRDAHDLSAKLKSGSLPQPHAAANSNSLSLALSRRLSIPREHQPGTPQTPGSPGSAAHARSLFSEILHENATENDLALLRAKTFTRFDFLMTCAWIVLVATHVFYLFCRIHFMVHMGESKGGYNMPWSIVCLSSDFARFIVLVLATPIFWRQITRFVPVSKEVEKNFLAEFQSGKRRPHQHVHCMVVTYKEPVETVRQCIQHLVEAPMPPYATKTIYLGDDGSKLEDGAEKACMVEDFRKKGHNVIYVGDRVKKPTQLNGKSSNLNHIILNKIYPHIQTPDDIPWSDLLMVMDCDHLVHVSFFQKVCAVMLDPMQAVCLVPQAFYNAIHPDFLDNANRFFMFGMLPYFFGMGVTFITGTNFMVRARPCFHACQHHLPNQTKESNVQANRQLFSEVLVAEDVDLGSRLHFLGYKATFIHEELAWGEVPLPPREIWKQRNRWAKAGHMYVLDKHSVFWKRSPYMGFFTKLCYCTPMIIHFLSFFSEPITIITPPLCILGGICPFGMSRSLWMSHIAVLVIGILPFCLPTFFKPWRMIFNHVSNRVQLLVSLKAVVNTVLVMSGLKKASGFKTSKKAGAKASKDEQTAPAGGQETVIEVSRKNVLTSCLESRKRVLPYEGTLDIWVIIGTCAVCVVSSVLGLIKIARRGDLVSKRGSHFSNLQLMSVVFCMWEAIPGIVFLWYCVFYHVAPWTIRLWVPLVCTAMVFCIVVVEVRLGLQYLDNPWDYFFGYDKQYS